ncbi:hypothetical protein ACFO3J_25620 [Streptomyces polygonati]|uniref:Secreted protein n=1 Tax=Streptomyces polygonati TaxID=1617087 RepID=A0ABV8HS85_9ACTN
MGIVVLVLLVLVAAGAAWNGRVVIPPDQVGIVRRRAGRADPTFRRITPHDTRGLQARTLPSNGVSWLVPGLYSVVLVPLVHVPEGMVGLVTAQEGRGRPPERPLGLHVDCDSFQDGQAFLSGGGEQGRQVTTLAGGQS